MNLPLHSNDVVHKVRVLQCIDQVVVKGWPYDLQPSVLRFSHGLFIHSFAVQPSTDGTSDDTIGAVSLSTKGKKQPPDYKKFRDC